jgi:hypothetical protein
MKLKIIEENINYSNGYIEGHLKLSNKRIINFEMCEELKWRQWGGSPDEHWITVERLNEIYNKFY